MICQFEYICYVLSCQIPQFLILIVMRNPTGQNTTDVLKLTCHYFILAVYLLQRPDGGLVN